LLFGSTRVACKDNCTADVPQLLEVVLSATCPPCFTVAGAMLTA
jgi:hypothetical protein